MLLGPLFQAARKLASSERNVKLNLVVPAYGPDSEWFIFIDGILFIRFHVSHVSFFFFLGFMFSFLFLVVDEYH